MTFAFGAAGVLRPLWGIPGSAIAAAEGTDGLQFVLRGKAGSLTLEPSDLDVGGDSIGLLPVAVLTGDAFSLLKSGCCSFSARISEPFWLAGTTFPKASATSSGLLSESRCRTSTKDGDGRAASAARMASSN